MDQEGPYRIAAVAELTGVPEPTLRAWERRYGVPSPERTSSGYRLYGHMEVEEVRAMRRLCDQGMAAAEAAEVVRSRRGALTLTPRPSAIAADVYDATVQAMLDAVERFDDEAFETQIRRLPLLGGTVTILERVLTPALRAIGDRWHAGELSVAQERLASQRFGTFLRDLLRLSSSDEAADRVILTCFGDDEHELGLLVTATRLALWGMRPVYMGGRLPASAVKMAVEAMQPRLVAFSATTDVTRARARELAEEYQAACGDVPWIVGGASASSIADLVEKHGGRVAPDDPDWLRQLVRDVRRDAAGKVRKSNRTKQERR